MVDRLAVTTSSLMEEADLRDGFEVSTWIRSDRYGGARLCMALNVLRRIL